MKKRVYAIRDSKVGFMSPVIQDTDAVASRSFEMAIRQARDELHTHKEDFDLYCLGTYDTETGRLESFEFPVVVYTGISVEVEK